MADPAPTIISGPELISSGNGLVEAPVWHPDLGLIAAETTGGGVWTFNKGQPKTMVLPHRRGIGGMVRHADGGLVVSGRNIAYKNVSAAGEDAGPTIVLLQNDPAAGIIGFNDLTTDRMGRIYVGSVGFVAVHAPKSGEAAGAQPGTSHDTLRQSAEGKSGSLHLIDVDGSARVVSTDIALTNGLGFSPSGKILYHSDSVRQCAYRYDVLPNGDLSGKRVFARVETGMPDGLAVDEAGFVWIAIAHGSAVAVFDPQGREVLRIPIPAPMVTSLCFGGPDRRDLYICTGFEGSPDLGGCVLRARVGVPGLALTPAKVRLAK
ncbi:MAG: SMP-30/gluconolactonase/LRE family protein [Reyranellaceae bacterium]